MTRDEILKLAHEAATEDGSINREDGKDVVLYAAKTNRFLERFAALVAAAEREACAKLCSAAPAAWAEEIIDDLHGLYDNEMIKESDSDDALIRLDQAIAAVKEAAAIRARGNK